MVKTLDNSITNFHVSLKDTVVTVENLGLNVDEWEAMSKQERLNVIMEWALGRFDIQTA